MCSNMLHSIQTEKQTWKEGTLWHIFAEAVFREKIFYSPEKPGIVNTGKILENRLWFMCPWKICIDTTRSDALAQYRPLVEIFSGNSENYKKIHSRKSLWWENRKSEKPTTWLIRSGGT